MEYTDIVKQYKQLELILGSKYIDIADRLKLYTIPYCLKNKEFCYLNHSKKCEKTATRIDYYQSSKIKFSLTQNNPIYMLKMIEDICLKCEYPGEEALLSIFELILTICEKKDSKTKCTKNYVLNQCHIVMENLLFKFPPCWHDLHDSYKKVLLTPLDTDIFLLNENENHKKTSNKKITRSGSHKQNIFEFILTMLEEIITTQSNNNGNGTETNNDNDYDNCDDDEDDDADAEYDNSMNLELYTLMNSASEIINFNEWEAKQITNKSFNSFTINDKLNRLFLILHYIVHILEYDLSVWMLRHASKNTQKYMLGDIKPIISSVFQFNIYNLLTDNVKKTLKLFILMIGYKFSENRLKIFNRLISMLSVAINLCETSDSASRIIYPNIGMKTVDFSKILYKTVEENFPNRIDVHLLVIENLRIPFIKFLYIDQLLCKMDIDFNEMSVEKITKNFRNNYWLNYPKYKENKENENKLKINNENCPLFNTKTVPVSSSSSSTSATALKSTSSLLLTKNEENFKNTSSNTTKTNNNNINEIELSLATDVVRKQNFNKKSTKQNEIYRHEYLNLLLIALKSCCDTYAIKNVLKIFENDKKYLKSLEKYSKKNTIYRRQGTKRGKKFNYNLDKVEKDIEFYEKQLNLKTLKKLTNNSNQNEILYFDGIYIDEKIFSKYRNEIKFLLILKKNIPMLKQKYGDEFNNFNQFMNEIFDVKYE